jgi:hypothetical protein
MHCIKVAIYHIGGVLGISTGSGSGSHPENHHPSPGKGPSPGKEKSSTRKSPRRSPPSITKRFGNSILNVLGLGDEAAREAVSPRSARNGNGNGKAGLSGVTSESEASDAALPANCGILKLEMKEMIRQI